jgi:hypothetical protein
MSKTGHRPAAQFFFSVRLATAIGAFVGAVPFLGAIGAGKEYFSDYLHMACVFAFVGGLAGLVVGTTLGAVAWAIAKAQSRSDGEG